MFPFRRWFQKTAVRKPLVRPDKRRRQTFLRLEQLEDRITP